MQLDKPTRKDWLKRRQGVLVKETPSEVKLRELILHIAHKSEGDQNFGKVKLYKLLFFCDALAYLRFGKSITGYRYCRMGEGPAPDKIQDVLKRMVKDTQLAIRPTEFYQYGQQRPFALRLPDLNKLSGREVDIADDLISKFWTKTGKAMSLFSHRYIGWKLAKMGERIPFQVALGGNREPSIEEISHGLSLEPLAKSCLGR